MQPDVVLAHRHAGAGAEGLLPLADQVHGPVVLLAQLGEEAGVGGELVAGQAGVAPVAGLAGWQQAPSVGQDPVGPLVQLQHVVEVAGADLELAAVGGELPVAQELGFVGLGQGLLWRSQILQPSECLSGGTGFNAFIDVRQAVLAAAVVGRVGGPVSGGGSLPGDSDADVDAEQSGQQGCGEFGGEAEQRGRACRAGAEPELAQSLGQAVGADRLAGLPAGEQPAGASLVAQCGVSAAGGGELEDEGVEWLGQHDGLAAEPEPHVLLVGVNMVQGEAADRGGSLGVEENEQAGDAVLGFDGVVVEQAAGVAPSGLGVDDAGRPVPPGGGEVEAGQFLAPGPADEVPGLAVMGGVVAGQPGVEVALPGGGQLEAAGGEPVQQRDGGPDVPLDGDGLAVGDVLAAGAAPEPAQGVPDGVAVQQLPLAVIARVRRWWP